jgi:hypothetical protein
MRKTFVAVGLLGVLFACATPSSSFAQGVSLRDFTFGLETGLVNQDLGSSTLLSGSLGVGGGVGAGTLENGIDKARLTRGMAKVTYHASPVVNPFLLVGLAKLSFDDDYRGSISTLDVTIDETVPFSDSSVAFGLGAEGKLLKLPAMTTLSYGVRFLTLKGSDSDELLIEELSQFDDATVATDASYVAWEIGLSVSRDFPVQGNIVLTPFGGLRHTSVHMNVATSIDYTPYINGQPVPMTGSYDRSADGNLTSIVLGCAGSLGSNLTGYLQVVALGETGAELGVAYRF